MLSLIAKLVALSVVVVPDTVKLPSIVTFPLASRLGTYNVFEVASSLNI